MLVKNRDQNSTYVFLATNYKLVCKVLMSKPNPIHMNEYIILAVHIFSFSPFLLNPNYIEDKKKSNLSNSVLIHLLLFF